MASRRPLCGKDGAVRKNKLDAEFFSKDLSRSAPRRASRRYSASAIAHRKRIGLSCDTVLSSESHPVQPGCRLFLRRANHSINRRGDISVAEIELSLRHSCLVSIHLSPGSLLG